MKLSEQKEYKEIMLKYSFAKKILETEIDILLQEYEFNNGYNPVEHTKSRLKDLNSAVKKLEKKGYIINMDNLIRQVHDMIGVRIVCSFLSDVYDIVNIIKSSKQFIIKEECDYIKNPKDSGYTSYHLNILVPIHLEERTEYVEAEIQIRTIAMDCWASLDHKLSYKLPKRIPDSLKKQMLSCSTEMRLLDKKMQVLYEEVKEFKSS